MAQEWRKLILNALSDQCILLHICKNVNNPTTLILQFQFFSEKCIQNNNGRTTTALITKAHMEAGDVELNPGPPTQTNIDIHELLFSVDSQDHFGIPQLLTSLLNIFQSAPFIPSILRNSSAIDKDGVMSGNYATTHYIHCL